MFDAFILTLLRLIFSGLGGRELIICSVIVVALFASPINSTNAFCIVSFFNGALAFVTFFDNLPSQLSTRA